MLPASDWSCCGDRFEFLEALTRVAILKYGKYGKGINDVSESVNLLLENDVRTRVPEFLTQNQNNFRLRLYTRKCAA
eukprot:1443248-Pyramimonas_sp.AAC.1